MNRMHWPLKTGLACTCSQMFATTEEFRDHLNVWCAGLQRITFKRREPLKWVSETNTPMHTMTCKPWSWLSGRQYEITCQCGWRQVADLPISGATRDKNSPGRLASAHIESVISDRLKEDTNGKQDSHATA